jgi:hypothetical protein
MPLDPHFSLSRIAPLAPPFWRSQTQNRPKELAGLGVVFIAVRTQKRLSRPTVETARITLRSMATRHKLALNARTVKTEDGWITREWTPRPRLIGSRRSRRGPTGAPGTVSCRAAPARLPRRWNHRLDVPHGRRGGGRERVHQGLDGRSEPAGRDAALSPHAAGGRNRPIRDSNDAGFYPFGGYDESTRD